jgi:hypothetical protein
MILKAAWPPNRGTLLINGRVNYFLLPEQSSMILKAAWPPKRGQAGFLDRISFCLFIYQLIGGSCIVYHNTITSRCNEQVVYFHSLAEIRRF